MGQTNEMDAGGPINRILEKRFGVQSAPAPYLASELFPFYDPLGDIQNLFLGNIRACHGYLSELAGGAGTYAEVGLVNPSGSGILVVVRKFRIRASGAQNVTWGSAGTLQAINVFGYPRDFRFQLSARTQAGIYGRNTGVSSTLTYSMGSRAVGTTADSEVDDEIVLGPGTQLSVLSGQANNSLTVSFDWEERAATEGELLDAAHL